MLADAGDPRGLFRAGFTESGATRPTGLVDNAYMQATYDSVVRDTGCSNSSFNSAPNSNSNVSDIDTDTLGCLRTVSADALTAAMNKVSVLNAFKVSSVFIFLVA